MVTQASAELEEIFRAHHARVLKAAYRVTGSVSDAEDVAQSVFLRLARTGIDRNRITYLEGYLHRAAVNGALDLIRSRGNREDVPLEDEVLPASHSPLSPERAHSSLEIRNWLRRALGQLSPRTAEMFVLRYIEGMDNPEIAESMNTSQAVVAVTLHRVRAKLKKDLRGFMRGAS
jgi:RNA polymerase sigma-70 factor (ECF subfamily)